MTINIFWKKDWKNVIHYKKNDQNLYFWEGWSYFRHELLAVFFSSSDAIYIATTNPTFLVRTMYIVHK